MTALVLAVLAALLAGGPAAAAAGPTVRFDRTVGFSGPAGTYPYGMDWDGTDNTVLVGDYWNHRVKRYTADGRFLGIVSRQSPRVVRGGICVPYDVEADPAGNVWVADQNCSRVVAFDHTGNWLRTIGLGGTPSYPQGCGGGKMLFPTHVLVHPTTHDVYVSDTRCGATYVYTAAGTFKLAFDWAATGLPKVTPRGLDIDASGVIHVVEAVSKSIVVFDAAGRYQRRYAGPVAIDDMRGLAIDRANGLVYVVAAKNNELFQFTTAGVFRRRATGAGGRVFDSVRFPAADNAGHVWVGDTFAYRTVKLDSALSALPWAQAPEPPPRGGYNLNNGVAVSPDNKLFVVDTYEQRVQKFDATSTCPRLGSCPAWLLQFGSRKAAGPNSNGFGYPRALAFGAGSVWVGDNNNAILRWTPGGQFLSRFGSIGRAPGQFQGGVQGVHVSWSEVYATDVGNCRLQVFTLDGALLRPMGSCGAGANQMSKPKGLAVAGTTAYVADFGNNRIAVWNSVGRTTNRFLSPACAGVRLSTPNDVKLDAAKRWLYVADLGNNRVVRMLTDGTSCQVVTTGSQTPSHAFGGPRYLAFGPDGRLYVSDATRHVYVFAVTG